MDPVLHAVPLNVQCTFCAAAAVLLVTFAMHSSYYLQAKRYQRYLVESVKLSAFIQYPILYIFIVHVVLLGSPHLLIKEGFCFAVSCLSGSSQHTLLRMRLKPSFCEW